MATEEAKRTIGYICPSCRQAVIAERTVFSLAAGNSKIPCPCGKSALQINVLGDYAELTVPCLFCGKEHTTSCSMEAFLGKKALAFSCRMSGLACCYVGEEAQVFAAMRRLEEASDKIPTPEKREGQFMDEIIMQEVLSEIKDIAQRNGISCTCGSHSWKMRLNYSSVDIICAQCGAALRLPAATEDDLADICCKTSLTIRREGQ